MDFPDNKPENPTGETDEVVVWPPKYQRDDRPDNIWIKSAISLGLYLVAGYFFFPSYKILFLITGVIMIHELGHFIAMKAFGYNDLGIFFIPLLGAYVSGTKREVSQIQSAIILLAGPLPGIIIGVIFILLGQQNWTLEIAGIPYHQIGILFMLLNLINLVPVYPLDGGQLLNRVFLDEESWISKAFVFLSAALMCWVVWAWYSKTKNPSVFVLLLFPFNILIRNLSEPRLNRIEKKIEEAGINTDVDYDDLPDEDYWKIRNILIAEHPAFKDVEPAPTSFQFSNKEERIMQSIEALLHRHLIQDISIAGKILILLLWAGAIASPWLLDLDMIFFSQFR